MNSKHKIIMLHLLVVVSFYLIGLNQEIEAQSLKGQFKFKSEEMSITTGTDSNTTLMCVWENEIVKETQDLAVKGNYLYLVNRNKGLYILDISNLSDPILTDSCILPGYCGSLTIEQSYLYIINDGLRIFSLNDISAPTEVGHWSGPSGDDIVIKGNLAYTTVHQSSHGYLYIIDINDKSNPVEAGNFDNGSGDLDKLDVQESYAYVGYDDLNTNVEFYFYSIDVSDPQNPEEVGSYRGHWGFSSWLPGINRVYTDIFVRDSYLYATHQYCGFGVFDVSDPANPTFISKYYGNMSAMYVEGNYVYVLDYDDDDCFRIINVSNPLVLTLTGFYKIDGLSQADITVQNGIAYVATDNLYIIKNNLFTDVDDKDEIKPLEYDLEQNYPNPFNPGTKIEYSIPNSSNVTIMVFDVLGNKIESLVNEKKTAGKYEVEFDASNLSSGVYYYRIQAGNFIQTKKMILLK